MNYYTQAIGRTGAAREAAPADPAGGLCGALSLMLLSAARLGVFHLGGVAHGRCLFRRGSDLGAIFGLENRPPRASMGNALTVRVALCFALHISLGLAHDAIIA